MWILDNLEDVKSDMSVFHRVDDIAAMSARSFFPRAVRLGAYDGVVQFRAKVKNAAAAAESTPTRPGAAPVYNPREVKTVPESVLFAEHENSGWLERG